MTDLIHIPANAQTADDVTMTDEPADVHIHRVWNHRRYGSKLGIDLAAPPWDGGDEDAFDVCKDDFKRLDWDATHRGWNDRGNEWEADFEVLNWVVEHMSDLGWDVTVHIDVATKFEDEDYRFLPAFRDEEPATAPDDADDDTTDDFDEMIDEAIDDAGRRADANATGDAAGIICTICLRGGVVETVGTYTVRTDYNTAIADITAYKCGVCGETGRKRESCIGSGGVSWDGDVRQVDLSRNAWELARGTF